MTAGKPSAETTPSFELSVLQEAQVGFHVDEAGLVQTREWHGAAYGRATWPSVLPPHISATLPLPEAVGAISAVPRVPEHCLNQ